MTISRRSFMACSIATTLAASGAGATLSATVGQDGRWWTRSWADGGTKAPFSGRTINHGCMFVADRDIALYRQQLGCYPDAQGALTVGQGLPLDSWPSVIGGPYADGVGADRSGTLLDWGSAGYTGHALRTPGCFIVPHGPTVPYGTDWSDFERVADGSLKVDGVALADLYRMMGQRIRALCREAGKNITEVVMRPNHEGMNQDTKLRLAGPNGERQLYLVGAANGRTTEQITATYNAAIARWAAGLWEGAEHRIPVALSPAMLREPAEVPEVGYEDWLGGPAAGVYDLVCFSFHPRPSLMPTDAAMYDLVTSTTASGIWTPAKAIVAARATAASEGRVVKACSLEVSCRLEKQYLSGDLSRYAAVIELFYDFMYRNVEDVAFINAHNINSFDPDWAVGKVGTEVDLAHWRAYVAAFRRRHGLAQA